MKIWIYICFLWIPLGGFSQSIEGSVLDEKGEPVPQASLEWIEAGKLFSTNNQGAFLLETDTFQTITLIIRVIGYKNDTLRTHPGSNTTIQLIPDAEVIGEAVISETRLGTSTGSGVNLVETLNQKEFRKAACCNISESFETNATVDVNYADAVTGAKTIQLFGLDGRYVQMTTELIPSLRGIASPYGLSYIPGTYLHSIQVGKGVGSVVQGYEGMTGQINIELKKPMESEKLFINIYANHMGRAELNLNFSNRLKNNWGQVTMIHGDYFNTKVDHNNDQFIDMPLVKQGNLTHRWTHYGEKMETQFGITGLLEDRRGGNLSFFRTDSLTPAYGVKLFTTRVEGYAKLGILFPGQTWKNLGFMGNFTWHRQTGFYGFRNYLGEQKTGYFNVIYQSIFDNTRHVFKTGASLVADDVTDELTGLGDTIIGSRMEWVPGAFFEYTFHNLSNFTLMLGGRLDYHSLFGIFPTPRLHVKYEPTENVFIRLSAGRGFRVPNIIADNTGLMITNRTITLQSPLSPEVSWNYGASVTYKPRVLNRQAEFSIDFFRTDFTSQWVADRETSGNLAFYLSHESAFSNVMQVNAQFMPFAWWTLRAGYKYQDVQTTYQGVRERTPFVPRHKGLLNTEFSFRKIGLSLDITGNLTGPSRIPPVMGQGSAESPTFITLNAQITKTFKWIDIYLGGENLTNYTQHHPILGYTDPAGPNLDASMVYAPIFGAMIYGGLRFTLEHK